MEITMSPTREQYPLSPKKVVKKTIASMIGWTVVLIIVYTFIAFTLSAIPNGGGSYYIGIVTLGFLVLFAIILILEYIYQRWYYAVYYYELNPDYITIRKGPITPREITIPYERFQDVYVDQDLLDRMMGLYDVHISSATVASGMQAHIDGVEKQAADGLKAVLLQKVNERISKKVVSQPAPTQ